MGKFMKTWRILEGILCNLFALLSDSDTKSQVESMKKFLDLEARLATIVLLGLFKKLVYTCRENDLNRSHKKVIEHLNLSN